jgi:hypothetical protein
MYCACLYLAAVAERFAPTAAANLYYTVMVMLGSNHPLMVT